jgi:hypothetical protein
MQYRLLVGIPKGRHRLSLCLEEVGEKVAK